MLEVTLTPEDDLTEKINSLPEAAIVRLQKGVYRQKVKIAHDDIILTGESPETTIISYGDSAKHMGAEIHPYDMFETYTMCVTGERVRFRRFTIENTAENPAQNGAAVALSVDASIFFAMEMDIRSTEKTIFLAPFPDELVSRYRGCLPHDELYMEGDALHLFNGCTIEGTRDIIFGGSEAFFRRCTITSLPCDGDGIGCVSAPSHCLATQRGFNFLQCNFVSGGAPESSVYIARPGRDFGKCAVVRSKIGNHIKPELYDARSIEEIEHSTDLDVNSSGKLEEIARFSYGDNECDFVPAPISWASELSPDAIEDIFERYLYSSSTNYAKLDTVKKVNRGY